MEFKELAQAVFEAKSLAIQLGKELSVARAAFTEAEKALSDRLCDYRRSESKGDSDHVAIAINDAILDCLYDEGRYELTLIKSL